jgi:hypothetical protein
LEFQKALCAYINPGEEKRRHHLPEIYTDRDIEMYLHLLLLISAAFVTSSPSPITGRMTLYEGNNISQNQVCTLSWGSWQVRRLFY